MGLGLGQVGCAMLLPAVCATAGAQLTGYLLGFAAQYSFGGTRSRTRYALRRVASRVSQRCDRKWICINIDSLT